MIVVTRFVWVCGHCRGSEENMLEKCAAELEEEVRRTKAVKDMRIWLIPLEALLLRKTFYHVLYSIPCSDFSVFSFNLSTKSIYVCVYVRVLGIVFNSGYSNDIKDYLPAADLTPVWTSASVVLDLKRGIPVGELKLMWDQSLSVSTP